ncbi:MAG: glycosyltransferase family 39 protein [Spirochaetota bacterium]
MNKLKSFLERQIEFLKKDYIFIITVFILIIAYSQVLRYSIGAISIILTGFILYLCFRNLASFLDKKLSVNKKTLIQKVILIFIIVLLFIGGALLYFENLDADPDTSLSWSRAFYTDEGFKAGNAVNKYLNDEWLTQSHNNILAYPLMYFILYGFFKVFGMSLLIGRLPVTILSVLIIITLIIFLIKRYGLNNKDTLKHILLLLFLIIFNYYFYIYSRIIFVDLPMASLGFFGLLLFYFANKSDNVIKKYILFIFVAIFFTLSYLAKNSGIIFIIGIIFIFIIKLIIERKINKKLLIGTVVTILLTIAFIYISFEYINNMLDNHITQQLHESISGRIDNITQKGNTGVIANIITNYLNFFDNPLIERYLILILISIFNIILILIQGFKHKKINFIDTIFIALTISAYGTICFFDYQPPRYFTIFIIPMVYFLATLPKNILKLDIVNRKELYKDILKYSFFTFFVIFFILQQAYEVAVITKEFSNPDYTIKKTAEKIKEDIKKDKNRNTSLDNVYVCSLKEDPIAGVFSLENHLNFVHEYRKDEENRCKNQYIIYKSNVKSVKPIGTYTFLGERKYLYKEEEFRKSYFDKK